MLYIHVPFCKQACHYCNFHFSTSLRHRDDMTTALIAELDMRRDYLKNPSLASVYFGGGTPSLLTIKELDSIFKQINKQYNLLPDAEITLEANPDDLTKDFLQDLLNYTPVNRLSIGVQSFQEADLLWMNRAHTAAHAGQCIDLALNAGFKDLTLDLIYGTPTMTDVQWADNLRIALDYGIPHLSCYCLTVEDGTALGTWVKRGIQLPVDEEKAARQFEYLMATTEAHGYEQYEISNFALPDRYARHNSNYWRGVPYLGIGPSAHSFDGRSRQWNIANNAQYMEAIADGKVPFEIEILTDTQRYNEYVMTMLRTIWGVTLPAIEAFGPMYASHFEKNAAQYLAANQIEQLGDAYRLTRSGRLLADRIAMELFADA